MAKIVTPAIIMLPNLMMMSFLAASIFSSSSIFWACISLRMLSISLYTFSISLRRSLMSCFVARSWTFSEMFSFRAFASSSETSFFMPAFCMRLENWRVSMVKIFWCDILG